MVSPASAKRAFIKFDAINCGNARSLEKNQPGAMCAFNVQVASSSLAELMAKAKCVCFAVCDYALQPFRITFDVFQLAGSDKFMLMVHLSLEGLTYSDDAPGRSRISGWITMQALQR